MGASSMASSSAPRDLVVDLRRELEQDGRRGIEAGVSIRQRGQQAVERVARLPRPQARRVGRGDVDRHVVGERGHAREAGGIVARGIGALLVHADIDAERAPGRAIRPAPSLQPRGDDLQAGAVEAHPVDQRALPPEAEEPGPGIARLRPGRHRARLAEAEAEPRRRIGAAEILVEAGGEAHGRREAQAPERHRKRRIGRRKRRRPPQPEQGERGAMRHLRRQAAEAGGGDVGVGHGAPARR